MDDASFERNQLQEPDPVIKQRIEEALERKRQEIKEYDEAIEELLISIAATPLPLKILKGLKLKKSSEEERLQRLQEYRDNLEKYSLPEIPEKVRRQIRSNRRSYQLQQLRKFLGDPMTERTGHSFINYPYDEGREHYYNEDDRHNAQTIEEKRSFRGPDDILRNISPRVINEGSADILIYDTSSPRPQPRYTTVIDALTKLGFAIDESGRRSHAAMMADTGLDIHALDEFQDRALLRQGHSMLYKDWIHVSKSEDTATGSFFIQGYRKSEEHGGLGGFTEINPMLSKICKDWDIDHLTAGLTYERTTLDTRLSLRVDKNPKIIKL